MKKSDKHLNLTWQISCVLSNLMLEFKTGTLSEELIIQYFSELMETAKVDTDITIAVLERFGDAAIEEARNLKVYW